LHKKLQKSKLPLFGELGQTSQESSGSLSDLQNSRDVCPNSSKSVFFDLAENNFRKILFEKSKEQLFEELGQTSQEFCESDRDPEISWDVCSNSSKSGLF